MKSQLLLVAMALCLGAGAASADQSSDRRPAPQPQPQERYQDRGIDENYYENEEIQEDCDRCRPPQAPGAVLMVPVLPRCILIQINPVTALLRRDIGDQRTFIVRSEYEEWGLRNALISGGPAFGPPLCSVVYKR